MFLADQWVRDTPAARAAADTTYFFDPIFKRYGYSFADYDRSVNYYLDRPEKYARILNKASERLRRENARLAIAATENEALRRENARLEKVLYGAERLKPYGDWVCAPVLSRGGALGARRMIRAGRGSRDGVKPGAAAAVPEGLAGRVVSVSPHACEILLLSDETFRVSCVFETENGECVYGILSGGGASRSVSRSVSPAFICPLGKP